MGRVWTRRVWKRSVWKERGGRRSPAADQLGQAHRAGVGSREVQGGVGVGEGEERETEGVGPEVAPVDVDARS
eukprot:260451-Rhodomonas_salina.1